MSLHRRSCLVLVCLLSMTASVYAEGWSLTSWIPGKKSTASKTSTTRTPLLGGKPLRSTSKTSASQPSMWSRMTNGTKKAAAKTKDAFSWNDNPEPRSRGHHTNWDDATPRIGRKKEEPSFWGNLFKRDEPRPSKTIQGFLSQERPEVQ